MIDAIVRLIDTSSDFVGPINLENPSEYSVIELTETIIQLTNSKSKIVFKDLPFDDTQQRKPDISLAKNFLKWEPKVTLEDGLKETIVYFKRIVI